MIRLRSERGQVAPLAALFLVAVLGVAALVLDIGSWFRADRATQAAADAAALAGAQELPYDTGAATGLAVEYTDKNGGGLTGGGISFSSQRNPNDTITVRLSRPAPGFFSKVIGIDAVTVRAQASARASEISQAKWVAPIVVNEKHPMLQCTPLPCFNEETELEYYHLKSSGAQTDGAGSFGFINLLRDGGNPGTSEMGNWIQNGFNAYMPLGDYDARTGNPFSSSHIEDSLRERIGSVILFPVYRKLTGGGSGAKYDIVAWVGFYLSDIDVHGSKEMLYGHFTEVIWDGLQSETGGDPDFGVRTVSLVD